MKKETNLMTFTPIDLLCTQKNDTLVRMTLPEDNKTILASEYKLYLPTSEQLIKEVDTAKKLAKGKM